MSNSSRRVPDATAIQARRRDLFTKQHKDIGTTAGDHMLIAIQHQHVIPTTRCRLTGGQHLFSTCQ